MAATAQVNVYHGVDASSPAAVTEVRHKRADNSTLDLNNPVQIPSSGDNRGWPKQFKLEFTTTPNSQISNLRWYASASPSGWDGISLWAGTTPTYAQATAGDESALRPGLADADTYTSGSPLVINSGVVLSNPTTGVGTQTFLQIQSTVNSTATPGAKTARQSFYRYDEI